MTLNRYVVLVGSEPRRLHRPGCSHLRHRTLGSLPVRRATRLEERQLPACPDCVKVKP